ncbi:MAG: helix-turn-helix domain-containing protein [Clostridia bacterium]|nr:helix-turn-helix domain-containing protein [Clostridia bacterium]
MKLSDKIYACRTRAKLSQEELAEQVGVSRQAVSRWECGDNVPEPSKLLMLARLFGVTADWLLDDAQEMPAEPHKEGAKQPWVDSLVENCKSLAGKFDRMLDECIPADKKEEQEADKAEPTPPPEPEAAPTADAPQDERRHNFGRLVDRFGWKLGVYIALIGVVLCVLSSLAQQVLAVLGGLMIPGGVILTVILLTKNKNSEKK